MLFVAVGGAGVASTFVDATIEGRKVTDEEILMSGLKGGFDTLIVSEVASAYEYRSYAKWQKTAPSVKAVTERTNNTIKSETCEGGSDTTRVGRWMSQEEYDMMISSGKVQMSGDNKVHVANPADINAFGR